MAIMTYESGREAEEYTKKYSFLLEPLEGALKEGYEKPWRGFIKRLECWAFIEKPRIYVAQKKSAHSSRRD